MQEQNPEFVENLRRQFEGQGGPGGMSFPHSQRLVYLFWFHLNRGEFAGKQTIFIQQNCHFSFTLCTLGPNDPQDPPAQ